MIRLDYKTRYDESVGLWDEVRGSQVQCMERLYENLNFYRQKALDLVCEKLVLDGLCEGKCDLDNCEYCKMAYEAVDGDE